MPARRLTCSIDPYPLLRRWIRAAERRQGERARVELPMTLATSTRAGRPSARIVLWKGLTPRGGVRFVTNYGSRKGAELRENPRCALVLHFAEAKRQIRIEGRARALPAAESDAYWAERSRASQLGAWASRQSRPIKDRAELLRRLREFTRKFGGRDVPRPPNWGGFEVIPKRIEFWRDRPDRLHERDLYFRGAASGWRRMNLSP